MLDSIEHLAPASSAASAKIGRLRFDRSGRVVAADERAARMLGYADTQGLVQSGRTLGEFLADGPAASTLWQPAVLKDAAGRETCVHARIALVAADVIDVHLTDAVTELLELMPSPVRADDLPLLELSHHGFYVQAASGALVYVNRALADMLGHEPDSGDAMRFFLGEDVPKVREAMAATHWRPGECREMTVRLARRRGGAREVVVRFTKVVYQGDDAFIGCVRDATEPGRSEKALKDYATRLRQLSQQVLEVQENERRNLARELHDEIGQQLTLVKLSLARLAAQPKRDAAVDEALDAVSALMQQVRDLSLDLRPSMLDDLGLGATLRWYVGRIARLASLETRIEIDPHFPRLSPQAETLIFRVAQESVTNVMRHAGAETLTLQLVRHPGRIELVVTDDGRGFDLEAARRAALNGRSAGLLGMHERALLGGAELTIESKGGTGTALRLVMSGERAGIHGGCA